MGLLDALGSSMDDPKTAGILALAGGMINGGMGSGLLGFNDAYQKAATAQLSRQDLAQQIMLRNIQLQQAQQQWKAVAPIYEALGAAYSGQGAPGASAPAQPAAAMNPGGPMGSGTFGIPTGGQPASAATPASAPRGSVFGLPLNVAGPTLALGGPGELAKAVVSYNSPTDFQKLLRSSGIDPDSPIGRQLVQTQLAKQNYIAPVNARPGSILRDPFSNQPVAFNPHVPDGTTPQFDANGNVTSFQPIGNAEAALALSERAKGFGKAEVTPSVVYGPDGKPQFSTVARDLGRAGMGGVQNISSGLQLTPELQAAIAADAKKNGITNPVVNLSTAEPGMPSASGFNKPMIGLSSQAPTGVTPQQAPGLVPNADTAQRASAESMKDSYSRLQSNGATANAALDALDKMMGLAAKKNPLLTAGPLGTNQSAVNPDAAEYEKQRANVISLLAQQGGTNGTDAGRALTGESVPDFGKPKAAIADGLGTLRNQVTALQLKRDFLTPVYQSGDSKQYTTLENQFDKNISPNMIPLLTMPAGKQRAFALQAAAKDPAMRARLDWAAANGLLK